MGLRLLASRLAVVAALAASIVSAPDALAATHPTVGQTNPFNGQTHVDPATNIAAQIVLVNGAGIDPSTLRPGSDILVQPVVSGVVGSPIRVQANVDGAGATITITPVQCLSLNTKYKVTLIGGQSGIQDARGVGLTKKVFAFTTTASGGSCAPPTAISFTRQSVVPSGSGHFTSLVIGPGTAGTPSSQKMLYAGTLDGVIRRWPILANGTLGTEASPIAPSAFAGHEIVGLAFQPAPAFRLWATVNVAFDGVHPAPDWGGSIYALNGANLTRPQLVVEHLPRSAKDHETNSLLFNGGYLYITQGSNSSAGAPDPAWNDRPEHELNAALLRLDLSRVNPNVGGTTLDVQTEPANGDPGTYDPFAPGAPLTIFADGIRNAFDLVLSGSSIYLPTNGAGPGGNVPAIPSQSSAPSTCQRRIDGQAYTGPFNVPGDGLTNLPDQRDFLFRVDLSGTGQYRPYGYYGHPNPSRCEWILGAGNPDPKNPATNDARVKQYPLGTRPDPNYRGYIFTFGYNFSPDGAIIYTKSGSPLDGQLVVARYSGGDDLITFPLPASGKVDPLSVREVANSGGKFDNPLDIAEDTSTGNLYVSTLDYPRSTIELLKAP